MLNGIDISNYQRANYKSLIDNEAKDFVICRAAWRYAVDPMCDVMYQYAKSKGKKLGVYFFPLTSDGDAKAHATWAYKQVLGYINEAIIALDWESYNGAEGNNNIANINWALTWLKTFEELSGVRPMIYMNSNCNSTYNFTSIVNGNFGLWIANYGNNSGKDFGRPPVKWWKSAAMHQYTSLGLAGKPLDRDTFYGDEIAWLKYAKSSKTKPSEIIKPDEPKFYTEVEVNNIIKSTESKYQAEIDKLLLELKNKENTLQVCEKVVKNAQFAITEINNYGNK